MMSFGAVVGGMLYFLFYFFFRRAIQVQTTGARLLAASLLESNSVFYKDSLLTVPQSMIYGVGKNFFSFSFSFRVPPISDTNECLSELC